MMDHIYVNAGRWSGKNKQKERERERERDRDMHPWIRACMRAWTQTPTQPQPHTQHHTTIHRYTHAHSHAYKIPIYPDHRHFQRRHRDKDTCMLQTFKIIGRPALELDGATMSYLLDVWGCPFLRAGVLPMPKVLWPAFGEPNLERKWAKKYVQKVFGH